MHILITGATWFIWQKLTKNLIELWHTITVLSRNSQKSQRIFSNEVNHLQRDEIMSSASLSWIECIIHLAWASINTFPWNTKNKKTIRTSRIETTKLLVAHLPKSCHSFICGSAIWYYPSSFEQVYESSFVNKVPSSFMEQLCVDREKEANKAASNTVRVINLRTWIVLWDEKFWKTIRQSTKYFGWIILWTWKQWIPTIDIETRVDICAWVLMDSSITWPINMVERNIRHEEYIKEVAAKLRRPVRCRVPSFLLKSILWEFSWLILGSWNVMPYRNEK